MWDDAVIGGHGEVEEGGNVRRKLNSFYAGNGWFEAGQDEERQA